MKHLHKILLLTLLSLACAIVSCSGPKAQKTLDRVESIIEAYPDSALAILSAIDRHDLKGKKQHAQYALLMSMALDKNYIDTTTFDILQPAIEYYLKKGTPDEKLKTYYYQGRIFQNSGDIDNALNSYMKAADLSPQCRDSVAIARAFMVQGYIYHDLYDLNSYVDFYLKAGDLYGKLKMFDSMFDCLHFALNGAIMLRNKEKADSIINLCNSIDPLSDRQTHIMQRRLLLYTIDFGDEKEVREIVEEHEANLYRTIDGALNLVLAYERLGEYQKANEILETVKKSNMPYDSLKFYALSIDIFDKIGDYKESLATYRKYNKKLSSINSMKFNQKVRTIEERHKLELELQEESARNSRIIWGFIGGIVLLILGIIILLLLLRSHKTQKELAFQKVKTKDAENAILKSKSEKFALEKEQLTLENNNLQLERDKKILEAENLAHRVATLENESESLKI